MNTPRRLICISAVMWLASGPGIGTAKADDVQVNTYTTSEQVRPKVALDADGGLVVVWYSYGSGGTDSSNHSIQGQRYAADGSAAGGEFQVNTYTTGRQYSASASTDDAGNLVVVWESFGSGGTDSSERSVQGQRYAADGSAVGGEFQVNTYTTSRQGTASVAMGAGGDFVVVWSSNGSAGTDASTNSIQAQRYAADGSAVGDEFQVNTYTTDTQVLPSVALAADDDFVVVWTGLGSSGTDSWFWSIQGRRYAADGSPLGDEFQVNTYTTENQINPSVALAAAGDFVVVWQSNGSSGTDSSGDSIQGQRYAADGSTAGAQFQVNTYTMSHQLRPSVAVGAAGDFVVVWNSFAAGGPDFVASIQGRRYAPDGSAVGDEFQINCYTTGSQSAASVALDAAGDFVVAWQSTGSGGTDSSYSSIQKTPAKQIFADGFESGDVSAWSSSSSGF